MYQNSVFAEFLLLIRIFVEIRLKIHVEVFCHTVSITILGTFAERSYRIASEHGNICKMKKFLGPYKTKFAKKVSQIQVLSLKKNIPGMPNSNSIRTFDVWPNICLF